MKILHLGLGRFHRGHQAVYYQRLAETFGETWDVIALSMRSPGARDELREAGFSYPVLELSANREDVIHVNVIKEALDAQEDFERVLTCFKDPAVQIITLTITEKGYCLKSDGTLDLENPGIKHDLSHPENPQTAIGLLALGLRMRNTNITVLSCDNLRENGSKLRNALRVFLKEDLNFASFPNTMVDRIVPSLDPVKAREFSLKYKVPEYLIATEVFSQWVIEDDFKGERPKLEKVGVEFVKDVRPFEEMKLRLLNASHSYLAYAGTLKGYDFVHEAIADDELRNDVETLMLKEVGPLLKMDVKEYAHTLLERFKNDKLPHKLRQIAMDGSQKIPQRIIPSLLEAESSRVLTKAVAAWLSFLWLERNGKIDDPKSAEFLKLPMSTKEEWIQHMLKIEMFKGIKESSLLQIIEEANQF